MEKLQKLVMAFCVSCFSQTSFTAQAQVSQAVVVPSPAAAEALQRARVAYRRRDFAAARQEVKTARELQKDWAEPLVLEALVAWQERKNGEALNSLKAALRLQPNHQTAHYLSARLFFENNKFDEARAAIKAVMDNGAQFADAYVLQGDIELMQHKMREALSAYEKATGQPAPKNELTPELQLRIEALRNSIAIFGNKNNPNYVRPEIRLKPNSKGAGGVGKIMLGGVVTEQGEFVNVIIIEADVGIRGKEGLLEHARQFEFKAAKRDGKPVPFWLYISYEQNTMLFR